VIVENTGTRRIRSRLEIIDMSYLQWRAMPEARDDTAVECFSASFHGN
jgi:hypothetical protein